MNKLLASLGLCLVTLVTIAATVAGPVSAARPEKVSVCHLDVDAGTVQKLSVGASAASAHLGHGDVLWSDEPCPPVAAPTAESLCVSVDGVFTRGDAGVSIWTCASADWTVEGAVDRLDQQCDEDGGMAALEGTSAMEFTLTCAAFRTPDPAQTLCTALGGNFTRPDDGATIWRCTGADWTVEGAVDGLGQQCDEDGGMAELVGTLDQTFSLTCAELRR